GVAVVRTPNLDARSRVPREDRDLPPTGHREGVRFIWREARSVAGRVEPTFFETVLVGADGCPSRDEVRVDEEVPETLAGQKLLEPCPEPRTRRADGTRPLVS